MTILFAVTTIYGVFSVIVNITVAIIMFSNWKRFRTSYYKLYLISSFINLLTYLNSWITLRLPNVTCQQCNGASIFEMQHFFGLEFFNFLMIHFSYLQCFMIVAIALNRLTALLIPFRYEQIWRKYLLLVVGVVILLPLPATAPILFNKSSFVHVNAAVDYYYLKSEENYQRRLNLMVSSNVVGSLLTLILTTWTFVVLLRSPSLRSKGYNIEIKLWIHNIVNVAALLFSATILFLMNIFSDHRVIVDFCNKLMPFVSDALTFISPYVLLLCSSELRKHVVRAVLQKEDTSNITTEGKPASQTAWPPSFARPIPK